MNRADKLIAGIGVVTLALMAMPTLGSYVLWGMLGIVVLGIVGLVAHCLLSGVNEAIKKEPLLLLAGLWLIGKDK